MSSNSNSGSSHEAAESSLETAAGFCDWPVFLTTNNNAAHHTKTFTFYLFTIIKCKFNQSNQSMYHVHCLTLGEATLLRVTETLTFKYFCGWPMHTQ